MHDIYFLFVILWDVVIIHIDSIYNYPTTTLKVLAHANKSWLSNFD